MTRTLILTLFVAIVAPIALAVAHAQAPQASSPQAQTSTTRLVRFAGVLTDAAGGPLTGPQTVTFTLFEQADGGTPLWTETLPVTADDRGRYAVALGASTPVPQDLFTAIAGRDLGRTALVAVPYALKAADADTLGGQPAATYVRTREDGRLETSAGLLSGPAVDGTGVAGQIAKWTGSTTLSSSVISESASNRIGFGLTDPTGGGIVDSVFTIRNYDNNTGFGILNETQQRRFAINTLATGGWLLYDGGSSTWNSGLSQQAGKVGIGTTSGTSRLSVIPFAEGTGLFVSAAGTASLGIDSRTQSGIALIGEASGAGIGLYASSASGFAAELWGPTTFISGNLGVGSFAPADKLDVDGDVRVGTGTTGCVKDSDGTVIAGTCSSDLRFKKNITPFANTLGKLSQLQAVHFDWRADEFPDRHFGAARSFGLVAQDVEALLPELVVTDDQGFKAVKYSELPLYMLQALKELKTENDALRQQLQAQEERLNRLEALARK